MYHSEFEANLAGFSVASATGVSCRKPCVKSKQVFGLFHFLCYAGAISAMCTLLSIIF